MSLLPIRSWPVWCPSVRRSGLSYSEVLCPTSGNIICTLCWAMYLCIEPTFCIYLSLVWRYVGTPGYWDGPSFPNDNICGINLIAVSFPNHFNVFYSVWFDGYLYPRTKHFTWAQNTKQKPSTPTAVCFSIKFIHLKTNNGHTDTT